MHKELELIHPGEILFEEFIKPYNLSQNQLALYLQVPPNRINQIVNGKREISADTALRLARFFQTSPEFWLNLQNQYNLELAKRQNCEEVEKIVIYNGMASGE